MIAVWSVCKLVMILCKLPTSYWQTFICKFYKANRHWINGKSTCVMLMMFPDTFNLKTRMVPYHVWYCHWRIVLMIVVWAWYDARPPWAIVKKSCFWLFCESSITIENSHVGCFLTHNLLNGLNLFSKVLLYHFNWFGHHTSQGLWFWLNSVTCPLSQPLWPMTFGGSKKWSKKAFKKIFMGVGHMQHFFLLMYLRRTLIDQ